MCLTGVDYFSSLGYQPGIAALAAGLLSPLATLVLVLVTLLGALPVYRRVAADSPHGEGSIAMLVKLLSFWKGKLFVLALLGFAATDFIITITLSAADATAHVDENPFWPDSLRGHQVVVTLVLVALLGAVFLKGFTEAIGIAVALVGLYLALNVVVVGDGLWQVLTHPHAVGDWTTALTAQHGNPLAMVGIALLVFPKLALAREYSEKFAQIMADNDIADGRDVIFVEVTVTDASDFETDLRVRGEVLHHRYRVVSMASSSVPSALAALVLWIRDNQGRRPHIYFEWTEGNPVANFARYLIFGQGEVAPVTREMIRQAEPDRARRPHVHVG
jgi:hypothetical protein